MERPMEAIFLLVPHFVMVSLFSLLNRFWQSMRLLCAFGRKPLTLEFYEPEVFLANQVFFQRTKIKYNKKIL
jgi:hypothetical protein